MRFLNHPQGIELKAPTAEGECLCVNSLSVIVVGVEVVTRKVRKVRPYKIPGINPVLGTWLTSVDILTKQLFCSEELTPIWREYLYRNDRVAEMPFEQAMCKIARPGVKAEVSRPFKFFAPK